MKRGLSQPKSRTTSRPNRLARRRLLVETLETRQLLAGGLGGGFSQVPGEGLLDPVDPRNIGTVQAFQFVENELPGGRGLNDSIQTAQFLPLGTGPGQQSTIDIIGTLPTQVIGSGGPFSPSLPEDVDYYSFDLRAGDILDLAGIGSVGAFDVFYSNGQRWFATEQNQALFYPANSPLQTLGNVAFAQVVPEDGRYFLRLAGNGQPTGYTFGLRVYRPVLERQPIGTQQKLFLDFDGATIPASVFTPGLPGTIRVPTLADSLNIINLQPQDESRLIDITLAELGRQFGSVAQFGGNGDFNQTGIPGQFGIQIFNSRDHADPGNDPFTTRVLIGGSINDYFFIDPVLGLSQTLDIGNFSPNDTVVVPVEFFEPAATTFPISNSRSVLDALGTLLGTIISHEAGHSFGLRHTDPNNAIAAISDTGGSPISLANFLGIGPDGIFGTADDIPIVFPVFDRFDPAEGIIGNQRVAANLAWGLATGTVGGGISGTVFNDLNRDGNRGANETGLGGITVYVDRNGNGILDAGDTSTVTAANGTFTLPFGGGTAVVRAVIPAGFAGTGAQSRTVTVATGGSVSNINFGLSQVQANITGTKFADLNGNGFRDPGEPGIPGVFVYLDLDGDGRIDIGEPRAVTDENGQYSLNFPGPGTYIIREVVEPGFEQTFPVGGAHVVTFTGAPLGNNFDFGNRPNLDFGDLPNSYQTTLASGGPSHGILAGLSLGTRVDAELDGQPSVNADGDDLSGPIGPDGQVINDEDGVRLVTPLGPGAPATFEITTTNTTGQPAFLQAWFDFNQDGQFQAGEQVLINRQLGSAVTPIVVNVPSFTEPGPLYARFRYSLSQNLGVGGQAATGEVEDYVFFVQPSAELAVDDSLTVSRNTQANQLEVLANDFDPANNPLTITGLGLAGTRGNVFVAADSRSVFYTPPLGFTGLDTFTYSVRSLSGETATATVTVNVTFLSDFPIAVDDTFDVAAGISNVPLAVLDNDLTSTAGGIRVISVTAGNSGGQTSIVGGSQSVRYTPAPGFRGIEEFSYSIADAAGNVSSAKVTVSVQPLPAENGVVDFSIRFLDPLNTTREITNVQAGDEFLAQVVVTDIRTGLPPVQGVFSAFLDLLYTEQLVSIIPAPTINNPFSPFDFQITFGSDFQSNPVFGLQGGDASVPGLIDEVGASSPNLSDPNPPIEGPQVLFTVRMQATAPGVAVFKANPADDALSETLVYSRNQLVTTQEQRFGTSELFIFPSGGIFTTAIDDSFPDGRDSLGNPIVGGVQATLDVTANDILGETGVIDDFFIVTGATLGTAVRGPGNTIRYTPFIGASGLDQFSYGIVTADGVRSTATVSVAVGNAAADDLVEIALRVVDGNGIPISNVAPGSRFGLQIIVDDLRSSAEVLGVFAAFADILYDRNLVEVLPGGNDPFGFEVVFGPDFQQGDAAFGVASNPGIIDEFGSFLRNTNPNNDPPNPALTGDPVVMATIFFTATTTPGANRVARFAADPADSLPALDTLLFQFEGSNGGPANVVPISRVRYGVTTVTIGSGAGGEGEAHHNALMPADVNADGVVSPMDALFVINQMSAARRAAEGESAPDRPILFTDVNGDGKVTTIDALHVINFISRQRRAAAAITLQTLGGGGAGTDGSAAETPLVYQSLEQFKKNAPPAFGSSSDSGASGSLLAAPEGLGDDDDEDSTLDLLANDLAALWG